MTDNERQEISLASLGWSRFLADQLTPDDAGLQPMRVSSVHRDRLSAISETGLCRLALAVKASTADFAVGDWVLAEPREQLVVRQLARKTLLQRRVEGKSSLQLIAANVDTLFIVTSCNADFEPARLERYLSMANEAETNPVILLTKADKTDDPKPYRQQALALQDGLEVMTVDARSPRVATMLAAWCGPGQTVALVGSSGVGKSTLVNTLSGSERQQTGTIREHDAKGRHTTTARSLHPIAGGGWVIDTPGMRTLHMSDASDGIDTLFAEISALAPSCRFRDCRHADEPGCAVRAAVEVGTLAAERLARWRKLVKENTLNTPQLRGARGNKSIKKRY